MPPTSWPGRVDFGRGRGPAFLPRPSAKHRGLPGPDGKRTSREVTKPRKGESPKDGNAGRVRQEQHSFYAQCVGLINHDASDAFVGGPVCGLVRDFGLGHTRLRFGLKIGRAASPILERSSGEGRPSHRRIMVIAVVLTIETFSPFSGGFVVL